MWCFVANNASVLVVDDEAVIADTLCIILKNSGYDAFAVYSAEEALDWCRNRCPDVVITDVVMGGLNGIQLAQRLQETLPDCKVVLISGNANTSALLQDWPEIDFPFPILSKPIHPQKILDLVAAL